MWHVFRLTLKDQTGRTVHIYELPVSQGNSSPVFGPLFYRKSAFRSGERRKSRSERAQVLDISSVS